MPVYPSDLFNFVIEKPGRTGTPYTASNERQYTRRWQVNAKIKGLGPLAVCTAPGIPRPGAFYQSAGGAEYDTNCLLTQLAATENTTNDDWGDYEVVATYSSRLPAGGERNLANPAARDDPTWEWPDIRWGSELMEFHRMQDLIGRRFINSAGEELGAGTKAKFEKISVPILTISRNELAFDALTASDYSYTVNHAPFLGWKKWAVMCMPPTAEAKWRGPFQYWRVSYTLKFFPPWVHVWDQFAGFCLHQQDGDEYDDEEIKEYMNTWQPLVLDAGSEEYRTLGTAFSTKGGAKIKASQRTPIFTKGHKMVSPSQPVMLNGKGEQLREEWEPEMLPYYCPFFMYPAKDFTRLADRGFAP